METFLPISIYTVGAIAQYKHAANRARRRGKRLTAARYFEQLPPLDMPIYNEIPVRLRTKKGEYELDVDPENIQWVSQLFSDAKSVIGSEMKSFDVVTDTGTSVTKVSALDLYNSRFLKVVESPREVAMSVNSPFVQEFAQTMQQTMSAHEIVTRSWFEKVNTMMTSAPVTLTEPLAPKPRPVPPIIPKPKPQTVVGGSSQARIRRPMPPLVPIRSEMNVEQPMPPLVEMNVERSMPRLEYIGPLEEEEEKVSVSASWEQTLDDYLEDREIASRDNITVLKPAEGSAAWKYFTGLQQTGSTEDLYTFMDGLVTENVVPLRAGERFTMMNDSVFQIGEDGSSVMAVNGDTLSRPKAFVQDDEADVFTLTFK